MGLSYQHFQALLQEAHPLVHIGLLLLCGYAGGRIASALKAPRVSGYVVVGMILSPSILGIFHEELVGEDLAIITDVALGIIAFSIGGALELSKIRRLGKQIFWITVTQAFGAFLMVTGVIALFFPMIAGSQSALLTNYAPLAIVVGAISAATAPAATLGVVTLDDALTILFFAFAVKLAGSLITGEALSLMGILAGPVKEIIIALGLGGLGGLFLRKLVPLITTRGSLLGVGLGTVFLTGGVATSFHSSALLANMMLGFMVVNFVQHSEDLFSVVENIEEPIFAMFFVLAGAHLDLGRFHTAGGLAVLIIVGRFLGKYLGSRLGATISGAPENVRKYLGLALLPKAGVTVGLVLIAKELFADPNVSELMVNAVLGSVIINELLSPPMVRYALIKSGEARQT
jgi:Kef-type K+ transport system membrane component KefB